MHKPSEIEENEGREEVQIYCMNCRIGCRSSERIWSLNLVLHSHGETLSLDIETLPVLLMNHQWSLEQRWKWIRAQCLHALSEGPKLRYLLDDENNEGVLQKTCNNHRYAVVVQDLATQWLQSYPCKTKTSQETQKSLMKFLEPTRKPKVIYTDNSKEMGKSCEELSWNHCTSTPHRSETNGIAERAVRRVKEGTSAVLLQSGLDEEWRAVSMECHCDLRNIQDLLSEETPYERRFGIPLNGPVVPFGAIVEYHTICEGHIEITSIWSKSLAWE